MKRLYLAFLLVIFCIFMGIFENVSICKTTNSCVREINKIDKLVSKNQIKKAEKQCKDTADKFAEISKNYIYCFYPHTSLENVEINLYVMTNALENANIEQYLNLKGKTKKQLQAIKDQELFILQNIL